jgi:hypothetical protein
LTDPIPIRPEERKELATEARELLDNKAFTTAILDLRKRWFAEMMVSADEAVDRSLKAKIQALEAIPQELQILINNQKMAEARKK